MAASVSMTDTAPFADSTTLLSDPAALRSKARTDGYLYLPGLLDEVAVRTLREEIVGLLAEFDFLATDRPALEAIARADLPAKVTLNTCGGEYYKRVQALRSFHALAHQPALLAACEALFAEAVLPHPRNILRTVFPNTNSHTTPPHQDIWYIHGTTEAWTAWLPIGACPRELGGLAILEGSHTRGKLPMQAAQGAGGQGIAGELAGTWREGDMACGDVLLLNSLTVHQGRDNSTPDQIRISADFRFQPRSHPVDASSLQPHGNILSWDEIYADWPAVDPLRAYWSDWDLQVESSA